MSYQKVTGYLKSNQKSGMVFLDAESVNQQGNIIFLAKPYKTLINKTNPVSNFTNDFITVAIL